jgi:hypothetical protein
MFKKTSVQYKDWGLNTAPFRYSFTFTKGEVGVELEMEGDNLPTGISAGKKMPTRWNTVNDGSLRASDGINPGGREYVLASPVERDEYEIMIRHIFRVLEETGAEVILSNRTSTHIHIDISKLLINQIVSFIVLWNIFEEAIVNSCGDSRIGNLFCLRTKDCSQAIEAFQRGIQKGLSFNIGENHKYLACNYYAMPHYGSLEFRCWPGADNPDQVISWIKFLLSLKDYAITHHANPELIGMAISENSPSQIFERICQDSDNMLFYNSVMSVPENEANFDKMGKEGYRRVQSLSYVLPWRDLEDEINKVFIPNPFLKPAVKKTHVGLRVDAIPNPPPPQRVSLAAHQEAMDRALSIARNSVRFPQPTAEQTLATARQAVNRARGATPTDMDWLRNINIPEAIIDDF